MTQTKVANGFVRRIRFKEKVAGPSQQPQVTDVTDFPKQFYWGKANAMKIFKEHWGVQSQHDFLPPVSRNLRCGDVDFNKIGSKFAETLFSGGTFNTHIHTSDFSLMSIEEQHDAMKWDAFLLKKKHMSLQLGKDNVNEMWLWHGTRPSRVNSLLLNGFDRNFGDRMEYGDGVYFAVNSSYSFYDGFAAVEKNNGQQEKVLLLSRVLIGETCQGFRGKKVPDTKADGTFCNSMTNNMSNPEMYILSAGSDNQSYIQFVLRFAKP